MKKYFIILLLVSFPDLLFAQLIGRVVGVADGDTFTMLTEELKQIKIRLHGIDCPEKKQAFGQVAKSFTSKLIFDQVVKVQITDIDRYGRTVGIVFLQDSTILNEKLLSAGMAWHFKRYDNREEWDTLEMTARIAKIGLWADKYPIAPWDYRKGITNSTN